MKDGWKILLLLILAAAGVAVSAILMKALWESDLPLWVKALLSK